MLSSPNFALSLLETTFYEFGEIYGSLLHTLKGVSEFLLLLQLLLKVLSLTLKLPLLLLKMVQMLSLLRLQLGLVLNIHLEAFSSNGLLMGLHGLFLLFDNHRDHGILGVLNALEVALVLIFKLLDVFSMLCFTFSVLVTLLLEFPLKALDFFAFLLLGECFILVRLVKALIKGRDTPSDWLEESATWHVGAFRG